MITAIYEITYTKKIKTKRTLKRKTFKALVASSRIVDIFGIGTVKFLEDFTKEKLHGTMMGYQSCLPWYNVLPLNVSLFRTKRKMKKGK